MRARIMIVIEYSVVHLTSRRRRCLLPCVYKYFCSYESQRLLSFFSFVTKKLCTNNTQTYKTKY